MRNFANHPRLFIARSTIHGLGLFAGEDIEWGQRVIEYQGEPLSTREVKRRQRFYDSIGFTCLMQFGDGLGVDAISGGNESRFINHSRRPNLGAIRFARGGHGVHYRSSSVRRPERGGIASRFPDELRRL